MALADVGCVPVSQSHGESLSVEYCPEYLDHVAPYHRGPAELLYNAGKVLLYCTVRVCTIKKVLVLFFMFLFIFYVCISLNCKWIRLILSVDKKITLALL